MPRPSGVIELPADHPGLPGRTLVIRDIEMDRARAHAKADRVVCPADFTPEGGLSGDSEIATAQATAEFLRRAGVSRVVSDRSLPLVFAEMIRRAGLALECDIDLGVLDRRAKDAQEVELLREAQSVTEGAMRMACELVARAEAGSGGVLTHDGDTLTAERVMSAIDIWLLERGYANPGSIVAPGPIGADCHERGHGPIRTGQPVIIDIFPQNKRTLYNGDCTRVVVHGEVPGEVAKMHDAVVRAKKAAIGATRAGVTGESVHRAAIEVITAAGYHTGLPEKHGDAGKQPSFCSMVHGTGHGIGRRMVEFLLDESARLDLDRVFLLTRAPAFFERCGFRTIDPDDLPDSFVHDFLNIQRRTFTDRYVMTREIGEVYHAG
jgi:Xaa-Pro aminopeptidase